MVAKQGKRPHILTAIVLTVFVCHNRAAAEQTGFPGQQGGGTTSNRTTNNTIIQPDPTAAARLQFEQDQERRRIQQQAIALRAEAARLRAEAQRRLGEFQSKFIPELESDLEEHEKLVFRLRPGFRGVTPFPVDGPAPDTAVANTFASIRPVNHNFENVPAMPVLKTNMTDWLSTVRDEGTVGSRLERALEGTGTATRAFSLAPLFQASRANSLIIGTVGNIAPPAEGGTEDRDQTPLRALHQVMNPNPRQLFPQALAAVEAHVDLALQRIRQQVRPTTPSPTSPTPTTPIVSTHGVTPEQVDTLNTALQNPDGFDPDANQQALEAVSKETGKMVKESARKSADKVKLATKEVSEIEDLLKQAEAKEQEANQVASNAPPPGTPPSNTGQPQSQSGQEQQGQAQSGGQQSPGGQQSGGEQGDGEGVQSAQVPTPGALPDGRALAELAGQPPVVPQLDPALTASLNRPPGQPLLFSPVGNPVAAQLQPIRPDPNVQALAPTSQTQPPVKPATNNLIAGNFGPAGPIAPQAPSDTGTNTGGGTETGTGAGFGPGSTGGLASTDGSFGDGIGPNFGARAGLDNPQKGPPYGPAGSGPSSDPSGGTINTGADFPSNIQRELVASGSRKDGKGRGGLIGTMEDGLIRQICKNSDQRKLASDFCDNTTAVAARESVKSPNALVESMNRTPAGI